MATIIDNYGRIEKNDADHTEKNNADDFEKNNADHTERVDHLVYSQLEDWGSSSQPQPLLPFWG